MTPQTPQESRTAEEIAKQILYLPVTNNQSEASIAKGAELIKKFSQQQVHSALADRWVSVGGADNLPTGEWLVIEKSKSGRPTRHVANKNEFVCLVGGAFSWDRNPIIAYTTLPAPPLEQGDKKV